MGVSQVLLGPPVIIHYESLIVINQAQLWGSQSLANPVWDVNSRVRYHINIMAVAHDILFFRIAVNHVVIQGNIACQQQS